MDDVQDEDETGVKKRASGGMMAILAGHTHK